MTYQIYNDDCIQKMEELANEGMKVDLIVTDPPYGMKYKSCRSKKLRETDTVIKGDGDDYYALLDKALSKCHKLLKNNSAIYVYSGWQQLDSFIHIVRKYFQYKNLLVWNKNNWSAGDLQGNYGTKTEFIIYATKGRHILNGKRNHNVLEYKKIPPSQAFFKFQKPTPLLEFLLQKSSKEGDTVLDFTMGSGSTGVACVNTNRNFIGIEIDKECYDIAEKRIREATTR